MLTIKYKSTVVTKYFYIIVVILFSLFATVSTAYCSGLPEFMLINIDNILSDANNIYNDFTTTEKAFFIKNLNATVTDSQICEYFKFNPNTDTKMLYIIKQKFELFKLIRTQLIPCAVIYKSYLLDGTPIPPHLDTQLNSILSQYIDLRCKLGMCEIYSFLSFLNKYLILWRL